MPVLTKNLLEDEPKCGVFKVMIVWNFSLYYFKCFKQDLIIRPPNEWPINDILTLSLSVVCSIYIFISLANFYPWDFILLLVSSSFSSDKTNTVFGFKY